jgi:hypothetical protein
LIFLTDGLSNIVALAVRVRGQPQYLSKCPAVQLQGSGVWLVVRVTQNFSLERVLLLLIFLERRAGISFPPEAMATLIVCKLSGAGGDYLILLDDLWSNKQGK